MRSPQWSHGRRVRGLFRARAYLGYKFSSFAPIGGVSFDYLSNRNATSIALDPVHGYEFGFSSERSPILAPGCLSGTVLS